LLFDGFVRSPAWSRRGIEPYADEVTLGQALEGRREM
jgi:hypothetical protein